MTKRIIIDGIEYDATPVQPAPTEEPPFPTIGTWWRKRDGTRYPFEITDRTNITASEGFLRQHTPLIALDPGTVVFKPKIEDGKAAVRKANRGDWCQNWEGVIYSEPYGTDNAYPIFTRHVVQPDGTLKENP